MRAPRAAALSGSKLLDHSQSPGPACEWGRQEAGAPSLLGPGTWLSSVVLPAATRGCPPRREGARRDARVPGFYSFVHSGFCFSMNAFMPIFWSLVEKVE